MIKGKVRVLLLVTWFCGVVTGTPAHSQEAVTAAWLPITQSLPFFIALEEKLFEKQGLVVTANRYEAPPQIIESLISNRSDVAFGAAAGLTVVAESEYPGTFKVFGLQGGSNASNRVSDSLIVKKGSSISGLKDLKSKSVATLPGIQWRLLGRQMLRTQNIDPEDVKFVGMPLGVQAQAVIAGTVDAALALEPIGSMAEATGEVVKVVTNPGATFISEPFYSSIFVMTSKFASERPEVARKLTVALDEAGVLANTKFEKYKPLLTKYMGVTEADLKNVTAPYFRSLSEFTAQDIKSWQTVSDIFFKENVLKRKVDVAEAVYQRGQK